MELGERSLTAVHRLSDREQFFVEAADLTGAVHEMNLEDPVPLANPQGREDSIGCDSADERAP